MNQNSNFADKWSRMFSQQDEVIAEDSDMLQEDNRAAGKKPFDKKKFTKLFLQF